MNDETGTRNLVLVLGDQLDASSAAFDGFEPGLDRVWMAEVQEKAEHVWSHKARIAVFLSAMRHFRDDLRERGMDIRYRALSDPENHGSFSEELAVAVSDLQPDRLIVVQPGAWRVEGALKCTARELGVPLDIRPDRHFFGSPDRFARYAAGRNQVIMEYFYRELRRENDVLMDGEEPVGDKWNLDKENREAFGRDGPGETISPVSFQPDPVTREVLELVEQQFPDHPGSLQNFDWPVTPEDARKALKDFIENRLACFGLYQDAMWTDRPYLYHSRLASAMNLKLLDPREAVRAAEEAFTEGAAPLNSVEGFVRQIIGWREFVRGVYRHQMPGYMNLNELDADLPLPDFYWTGETDMNCLRQCIAQTLAYGYAHHIQRLMVTGLFALLLGVQPQAAHRWYLAVYVDAVEWVELPNTLGMSQYADGGIMATKPYCASGNYIKRMSDYCRDCCYRPSERVGEDACPFTTLYWDFLMRHEEKLAQNTRMNLQLRNLSRLDAEEKKDIVSGATALRNAICR